MNDEPRVFICADCQAHTVSWGGDPSRDCCYNCTFVRRVCDTPEQEAEMRKILGCERQEASSEATDNQCSESDQPA